MKLKYSFAILMSLITVISLFSCKKTKNEAPQLTVNASTITFTADENGGTQDITVSGNSDWSISNPAYAWLKLSTTSGVTAAAPLFI